MKTQLELFSDPRDPPTEDEEPLDDPSEEEPLDEDEDADEADDPWLRACTRADYDRDMEDE